MNIPAPLRSAALAWLALALPRVTTGQLPGSLAADRARLAQLAGGGARAESLLIIRDSARMLFRQRSAPRGTAWSVVAPETRVTWNSAIPYSLNDGPLWAGRGWNMSVTGGVAVLQRYHGMNLRAVFAPAVFLSQNRPFQIFPNTVPGRSAFANPQHGPDASLDWPLRFGDEHLLGFDLGRSAATAEWSRVSAGVSSEQEWWGPGIRSALVMSNNAGGIPRLFVRTTRPLHSRIGAVDAELFAGALTQSRFFDATASENRSISGLRVELRPSFDTSLTIGFTRVVYAPVGPDASPFTATLARALDALTRWENLATIGHQRSDQIGSVYVRSLIPSAGMEIYGEWARMALPESVGELFSAPGYSGAWTFGTQWLQPRRVRSFLRLQAELSYLEQSLVFRDRATPDFYVGYGSPQGYTQRGQIIGAATGPGSSSQWFAGDWITRRWQAGAFVGRTRWDNDALYRRVATFFDHDVSLFGGIRGAWRATLTDISAELTVARRFNYLFQ
ncbi:MAG TPA: capsule assembly Wzi family protein, partial [Gemmatimonadaceae bacterium]|nr:capsule assembly Wzi family protein [Gemmatimonadaceae bacterium]